MNETLEEMLSEPKKPLEPGDGSTILPWKTDTTLRKQLYLLSEFVPVMLKIEAALQSDNPGIWWHCWEWDREIEITPKDEEHARKIVGKLIFAFGSKPDIKKISDDELVSEWKIEGTVVKVKGYKPKTCRYEEIEVKVPASRRRIEKKVIPAQKARIEKRRILVCDDAKTEPQVPEEVKVVNEVPF